MKMMSRITKRSTFAAIAFGYALLLTVGVLVHNLPANAASLPNRSLSVSSSSLGTITTGNPGSGTNGQKTGETIGFKIGTTGNVGSILLQYCTTPIAGSTCTAPTGFTAANIVTPTETGFSANNFTNDTSTDLTGAPWSCTGSSPGRTNCIALKRTSAASETASTAVTIVLGGGTSDYITNPSTTGTFFVRITTYSDTTYGTAVDNGTAASSTAQQISITAKVQEALNFSVGAPASGSLPAPGATCAPFTDPGTLTIGDANNGLSSSQAYDGHSYFRVSTNGINGTKILYSGDTLKSGANSIASIGETSGGTSSTPGTAQFGLGIDTSDTQSGNGYSFTSLTSTISPAYGLGAGTITPAGTAKFNFNTASLTSPVQIASSAGVISCDTGSVRYLANIATNTPPGIYTTTIDYIAVPTY
ncbi:MAG TPA: hypothetical protein VHT70_04525 [Candidatus Saccharimonadales bacterium]|jgi:hypothetical protein|nr:hypothetical protein [Candidatus Saccharimonadales bacterium]